MKVYVVEKGLYEDRRTEGVYATPELAMEAHPIPDDIPSRNRMPKRDPGWVERDGYWSNGLDWDMAAVIWTETVVGADESTRKEQP